MTFVKTRSGRYLKLDSIIGFAIEEEKMEKNLKLFLQEHLVYTLKETLTFQWTTLQKVLVAQEQL